MNSRIICLVIISFCLVSCKRPDPQPELSDRIYLDMGKELKLYEDEASAAEKKIEKALKEIESAEPRTLELKNAKNDMLKAQIKKQRALELVEYMKIRLIERKYEYGRAYTEAFSNDLPWPPPGEYEAYINNKNLKSASKNWSDRVPRPSRQIDPGNLGPEEKPAGE